VLGGIFQDQRNLSGNVLPRRRLSEAASKHLE